MPKNFRPAQLLALSLLLASCQPSLDRPAEQVRGYIQLPQDRTTVEAVVPQNATLEALLRQQQVPAELTTSVVNAVRSVFNPRDLRADQTYSITRTLDGFFREFRYEIDADNLLRVVFHDTPGDRAASFDVAVVPVPKDYEPAVLSLDISRQHNSLSSSLSAFGENIQLAGKLADMFGGEVDFNSDLHVGDRIDLLFDRVRRNGEFIGYGDVKAAVLQTGKRRIMAVRHLDGNGRAAWFDENGRSLRRDFLKSPLPFDPRVTSGFSFNRFHPTLGVVRPHLGVDFGAPYGTRVIAVAAGVVEVAGWEGEAGRMVRIRHAGGYQTEYLHLSAFGAGVRAGARIEQGDMVGRVGQTGAATGPHLDYRIIKNGVHVNPIAEMKRLPSAGEPVASDARAAFNLERDGLLAEMQQRLAANGATGGAQVNTPTVSKTPAPSSKTRKRK